MMLQEMDPWHNQDIHDVLHHLAVDPTVGLPEATIASRQQQHGMNELVERGSKSAWSIIRAQLSNVVMGVLVAAGLIKALIGEYLDAGAILAVILLNALLGFIQEHRAERAIAALKRLAAPLVRVRRQGQLRDVPARELVPGDIILLEAGNTIPADARVVEAANLAVQEASLTGESQSVEKHARVIGGESVPLGDRQNMLYLGTTVTYGRGTAVVTATGMHTELGRIAEMIQSVSTDMTPLQKRMQHLGITLAIAVVAIVALVFALGVWHDRALTPLFLAGVAIAVAAIPEGLPAVLTITLALGAQRMLQRRALIRRLPAVETLGSVTVICSDKTGTLTENRMRVHVLDVAGNTSSLTDLLAHGPVVSAPGTPTVTRLDPAQRLLLAAGALCNDAMFAPEATSQSLPTLGDPTEGALLVAAAHCGLWKAPLEASFTRITEVPFSSERKLMTTVHELPAAPRRHHDTTTLSGLFDEAATHIAFTKGAVDSLLYLSNRVWEAGQIQPLSAAMYARITAANDHLAQQGLRVLGLAFRPFHALPPLAPHDLEQELVFIGLVGMIDPPRPEVREAVQRCRTAGIRPVMITGDHPLTARQIARDLHIAMPDHDTVLTGQELARLSTSELEAVVDDVSVYARVSPEHKLHIVQALQNRGHIVSMTGDGVNDAPALRKSDIGVAMGITGTDVSKEAADMVITDDNFATIVHAVEEGRTIYDNVRKFVKYIVTSNSAEVLVMFCTQLFAMPIPMTTLQILWMNLVTDGVPGLALGLEPTEKDTMRRSPFAPGESIFSRGIGRHILLFGPVMALISFGLGSWAYQHGNPAWGTMVFVTLTLSQLGHALAVRTNTTALFQVGLRSNPIMFYAIIATLMLQMMAVYLPPFQALFHTVPLTLTELAICLGASTLVFWGVELEKYLLRRQYHANKETLYGTR
ncbi:MAG: cation-translocating P-type ATPase [Candidatus Tectimicrobiota bacterium]